MVQVHAPQGVEVRVLSWAPTGSPEQSEDVRETPQSFVPAGFFVFCVPMCSSNIQRFYVYWCVYQFRGQRHAQIRRTEVGIDVSQRQNRAAALPPLGRAGPFPTHTSERRQDLATSLSPPRHRERKLPEPWPL